MEAGRASNTAVYFIVTLLDLSWTFLLGLLKTLANQGWKFLYPGLKLHQQGVEVFFSVFCSEQKNERIRSGSLTVSAQNGIAHPTNLWSKILGCPRRGCHSNHLPSSRNFFATGAPELWPVNLLYLKPAHVAPVSGVSRQVFQVFFKPAAGQAWKAHHIKGGKMLAHKHLRAPVVTSYRTKCALGHKQERWFQYGTRALACPCDNQTFHPLQPQKYIHGHGRRKHSAAKLVHRCVFCAWAGNRLQMHKQWFSMQTCGTGSLKNKRSQCLVWTLALFRPASSSWGGIQASITSPQQGCKNLSRGNLAWHSHKPYIGWHTPVPGFGSAHSKADDRGRQITRGKINWSGPQLFVFSSCLSTSLGSMRVAASTDQPNPTTHCRCQLLACLWRKEIVAFIRSSFATLALTPQAAASFSWLSNARFHHC